MRTRCIVSLRITPAILFDEDALVAVAHGEVQQEGLGAGLALHDQAVIGGCEGGRQPVAQFYLAGKAMAAANPKATSALIPRSRAGL